MSNLARSSAEMQSILQTARYEGVEKVEIEVPTQLEFVTEIELFGYRIGSIKEHRTGNKKITFYF
jgi:hypothetical protein